MFTSFWLLQMCNFFWRSRATTRRIRLFISVTPSISAMSKNPTAKESMYVPPPSGWMAKTILGNKSIASSIFEDQAYTSIASITFFHLSISRRTSSIGEIDFNSRNRSFFAPGTRLTDPICWGGRQFQWVQTDQQLGFEFSMPRAAAEAGKDPWLFLAGCFFIEALILRIKYLFHSHIWQFEKYIHHLPVPALLNAVVFPIRNFQRFSLTQAIPGYMDNSYPHMLTGLIRISIQHALSICY